MDDLKILLPPCISIFSRILTRTCGVLNNNILVFHKSKTVDNFNEYIIILCNVQCSYVNGLYNVNTAYIVVICCDEQYHRILLYYN